MALEKDQKREQDAIDRSKRIQARLDLMADVVKDNGKELQLKQEKEYIATCEIKDEKARLTDINNKFKARAKHQRLNEILAN